MDSTQEDCCRRRPPFIRHHFHCQLFLLILLPPVEEFEVMPKLAQPIPAVFPAQPGTEVNTARVTDQYQ